MAGPRPQRRRVHRQVLRGRAHALHRRVERYRQADEQVLRRAGRHLLRVGHGNQGKAVAFAAEYGAIEYVLNKVLIVGTEDASGKQSKHCVVLSLRLLLSLSRSHAANKQRLCQHGGGPLILKVLSSPKLTSRASGSESGAATAR